MKKLTFLVFICVLALVYLLLPFYGKVFLLFFKQSSLPDSEPTSLTLDFKDQASCFPDSRDWFTEQHIKKQRE